MLSVSFAVEILTWSFLASSLLLCRAFQGLYQSGADATAVGTVFGLAVLASLMVALPLSVFVTLKVPRAMARRLVEELPEAENGVFDLARPAAKGFGISAFRILQSPTGVPFAYSVGGAESVMVVSRGLVTQLDKDEVETVLAHELAHVKNHDTALNTVVAVYRKVLFFDPFIRLMERAICSEKEFSADELSARETKKPLSLASALLKISSGQSGGRGSRVKIEGLSILGSSRFVRPPSVKQRIERLMELATELDQEALLHGGALYTG
jgi:Zn-dependent protease with chaperone function